MAYLGSSLGAENFREKSRTRTPSARETFFGWVGVSAVRLSTSRLTLTLHCVNMRGRIMYIMDSACCSMNAGIMRLIWPICDQ